MEKPLRKLGPYTLVSRIGVGGFGVVWLAEKRTAIATTQFALKLPRDEDIDLEAFRDEAAIWVQASGHPNVLPMIDADIYDEQVVIVSEYVPDGSLAGWLKQHGGKAPSAEAACEIMDGVLAGLTHLHARRIIHRDLKPENILLQRETPRLADFGIARVLKSSSHSSNVSGTLAYMAPEAFDGQRNEQTDAWSVGVIFYQLLAGRLPYDQPDMPSLIGAITRYDPPPLPDSVPAVLKQIVMKALQRDPPNRYTSAVEMRSDLREAEHQLWLGGRKTVVEPKEATISVPSQETVVNQPIESKPVDPQSVETLLANPSPAFVKTATAILPVKPTLLNETLRLPTPAKKKSWSLGWLLGGGVVVVILLLVGVSLGVYYWRSSLIANKPQTWTPSVTKQSPQITTPSITKPPPQIPTRSIAKQSQGLYALTQTFTGHTLRVVAVAFSPDGKMLATGSEDGSVKLWDMQTGVVKQTLNLTGGVNSISFSPDGRVLAIGHNDNAVKLWEPETERLRRLSGHTQLVQSVAFSPDGTLMASAGRDKTVRLWDAQTGMLKQTWTGSDNEVWSVAFSPQGTAVASSAGGTVSLWDVQTGQVQRTISAHQDDILEIAFSPDGKTLASASYDKTVKLWDSQTGALKLTFTQLDGVYGVAFSLDGTLLAAAVSDSTITLWDAQTGAWKQTLRGHNANVQAVAFSPDGKTLTSGSDDKTVKLWRGK